MSKAVGVSIVLGAALGSSVGSAFTTVDARVKSLRGNLKELRTVSAKAATLTTAEAKLREAKQAYAADPSEKNRRALVGVQNSYDTAEKAAKKYNVTVAGAAKAHAEATAAIKKQETALARMEHFQANKAKRSELRGEIVGTVAGFLAAGAPVKLAMDYDKAMAKAKRTGKFDDAGFAAFKKQTLALGGNLNDTGVIAALGGRSVAQNELLHFVAVGKKIAKAWEMSAEEAGEALGGIRTHFRLTEAEADRYLDTLSHLANNTQASAAEIMEFSHRTADIAKQYGVSRQQVAALGATMSALQIPAKQGISAAQGLWNTLGQAKGANAAAQRAFAAFGTSGKRIQAGFRKDAQGTMLQIFEHLRRYSGPMRMKLAKEIFGEGEANTVIKLVENLDEYKKAISLAADAVGSAGALQKDYKAATETASAALDRLTSKAVMIGTAMGDSNLPLVSWIANAGGGMLDAVFSLVQGLPTVTSAVVGFSTAMVGLTLVTKAGKYAGTLFSDGLLISKGIFNALRPSVLASRAAMIGHAAATVAHKTATIATTVATRAMAAGQWLLNVAMAANPIGIVVVALAALAAWFAVAYAKAGSVTGAIGVMWDQFKAVVPVMEVVQAAVTGTVQFVKDLWNGVSLYDAGAKLMGTLWEGVQAMWDRVKAPWIAIKEFFGFETKAPEVVATPPTPAVAPNRAVAQPIPTTTASTAAAKASAPSRTQSAAPAVPKPAPLLSGGGSASISPQITFAINLNGVPSKDVGEVLVGAIKTKERELASYLEKLIAGIAANQRRVAYDR